MENQEKAQNAEAANPQNNNAPTSEGDTQGNQEQDQTQRPSVEDQERNWKAMRESAEETKRENQALKSQLAEVTSVVKDLVSSKQKPHEPEEEFDDTDIPTLGQARKAILKDGKKLTKEVVAEMLYERDQQTAEARLKRDIADFDEVVSKKNVDYLIKKEPELAALLKDIKDQYKQGKTAYKFIKNLGFIAKDESQILKDEATKNAAKPVSPNAIPGSSSVGDANMFSRGLSPDRKKQLHQEMLDAIKGM